MTGGTFMNFDAFEKKAKELGVLGIVVTKDGKEIGKKLWDEQCRRNVYSASKSFTSTAVGIAVKEGCYPWRKTGGLFCRRSSGNCQ